jgi:hypothetical protein
MAKVEPVKIAERDNAALQAFGNRLVGMQADHCGGL